MHRIVVLGAGYAGAPAAGYLARRLHPDEVEIVVVNTDAEFVERMRLHQLAAGRELRRWGLAEMFAGTGVRLRLARVSALDAGQQTVTVTDADGDGDGDDRLDYDTLLYCLGSTVADRGVAGVAEHAFHVTGWSAALRLRRRLDELAGTGTVLVVGGNLTAIEAATEIAGSRSGLQVVLATTGLLGGWMGPTARRHVLRACDRLGVEVHEDTGIDRVTATGAVAVGGDPFPCDAVVWAAGFTAHPIAAASGLNVADDGRITVDPTMRSMSHPQVYAAGDSAFVIGDNGRPLPMSCASAGSTRMQATASILGELTGRTIPTTAQAYLGNCVSLGRGDAVLQAVDDQARSRSWSLRGRPAALVKAVVLRSVAWAAHHPTAGLPTRRHRVSAGFERSGESIDT
jgi:NADH:ubiquinone reductase (H+-translocating)